MTLLQNVGRAEPTQQWLPPDARPNDQADTALDLASIGGLDLYPWQENVLRNAMMRSPSGRWAAAEVGVVVPRQNGKGSILEARQVWGLFNGERLQLHSAHEFKTCYEHFRRVRDLVEASPLLMDQVSIIRTGAGDQAIELKNGCRIRFIARSRSSGRGFSADVVYLDEAFELSDATMGALLPALSARPDPQVWYTSSAPHRDSIVLHRLRSRGLAGNDPRLFYAEWSAPADADPADPENWAMANPSLGIRINEERIDTAQRSLDPAEFAREHLGIPEELDALAGSIIPLDQWDALKAESSPIVSGETFALDVSPDRRHASFAVAGRCADGLVQIEMFDSRPGTNWVVERAIRLHQDHKKPLRIEKGGPAGSFVTLLTEAGVTVEEVSTADHARATGQFIDAVSSGSLRHLGDQILRSAIVGATLRHSGDADLWSRRSSKVDITPLVAGTLALGGVPDPVKTSSVFMAFT